MMFDFFKQEFDKLILLLLVLIFAWSAIHGVQYSQRTNDLILGALIGLLTGKGIQKLQG